MEKSLIQVQKITPSVDRLTIVGKTRKRRRHVCAIFQACYLCLLCYFFASGHAITAFLHFAVQTYK